MGPFSLSSLQKIWSCFDHLVIILVTDGLSVSTQVGVRLQRAWQFVYRKFDMSYSLSSNGTLYEVEVTILI